MSNNIAKNINIDEASIYGKGINSISIDELKDNETAIKQLVNYHTIKIEQANAANNEIEQLKLELKFYQTYPFVGIIAGIGNVCGSVVTSFSINFLTNETSPAYSGWLLLVGIILIIMGVSAPICYQLFISKKIERGI